MPKEILGLDVELQAFLSALVIQSGSTQSLSPIYNIEKEVALSIV